MKKKRFLTLFGKAGNVELIKMTGMIPFKMYKKYGYKSSIVFYRTSEKFTYHKNVVKGLRLILLPDKGKIFKLDKSLLKFLFRHAKSIDILHRFHYSLQTLVYVIIYKILNPKGVAYITLDNDLGSLKTFPKSLLLKHPKNFIRNFIAYNIIEPLFLRLVDIMSSETKEGTEKLKNLYKKYKDKIYYQPYGIDEYFIKQHNIQVKSFEEKENIILTVSRIGAPQKYHEMLLLALEKVDLKDWKVMMVGKVVNKKEDSDIEDFFSINPHLRGKIIISKDFDKFLEDFFSRNPHLKDKIVISGHIDDRKTLYDLYNRSKIFVMTSLFESFGIVMAEAGYFRNYLLTTNVTSANDITKNGECGDIVPIGDIEEFARKLQFAIDHPDYIKEKGEKLRQHVLENFLWDNIVDRLQDQIERIMSQRLSK
ncbi:MAG: glycosyltransferase family 4 protein [Brevinematia bacterium]